MENISYVIKKDSIILSLPVKNKGKFRWKNRENNTEYGEGFATATTEFTEKSYLEWQIGYDMIVGSDNKTTILDHLLFTGANGKIKHPYELSEILYLLLENNMLNKDDILNLIREIEERTFSFDEEFKIDTQDSKEVLISNFSFHRQDIVLPTFSYYDHKDGLSIEISIQKQQYATGVQPMVYFTIPILCLSNHIEMIGKRSGDLTTANLEIDVDSKKFILFMFKFFGMCSWKHKHDVLAILNELI